MSLAGTNREKKRPLFLFILLGQNLSSLTSRFHDKRAFERIHEEKGNLLCLLPHLLYFLPGLLLNLRSLVFFHELCCFFYRIHYFFRTDLLLFAPPPVVLFTVSSFPFTTCDLFSSNLFVSLMTKASSIHKNHVKKHETCLVYIFIHFKHYLNVTTHEYI